jgi:hypothetical protein
MQDLELLSLPGSVSFSISFRFLHASGGDKQHGRHHNRKYRLSREVFCANRVANSKLDNEIEAKSIVFEAEVAADLVSAGNIAKCSTHSSLCDDVFVVEERIARTMPTQWTNFGPNR